MEKIGEEGTTEYKLSPLIPTGMIEVLDSNGEVLYEVTPEELQEFREWKAGQSEEEKDKPIKELKKKIEELYDREVDLNWIPIIASHGSLNYLTIAYNEKCEEYILSVNNGDGDNEIKVTKNINTIFEIVKLLKS